MSVIVASQFGGSRGFLMSPNLCSRCNFKSTHHSWRYERNFKWVFISEDMA